MQYWYPACAAVFKNLNTPFIMSASLLHTQMVQISYANNPEPTVVVEKGMIILFVIHSGNYGADLSHPPKLTQQTALILCYRKVVVDHPSRAHNWTKGDRGQPQEHTGGGAGKGRRI